MEKTKPHGRISYLKFKKHTKKGEQNQSCWSQNYFDKVKESSSCLER